jgi:NADH-quinone oxidoreductase subunit I
MTGLLASFKSLWVTGLNLFRPMTTEPLPWKGERARPTRFRTSFALIHEENGDEACIGCKMCEKICPSQIIVVQAGGRKPSERTGKPRGWATDFTLDLNACIHCELCIQVCPADAIVMLRVLETPGYTREDLFLTMDKLYANEKHAPAWGTGTKLIGMQEAGQAKPAPKAAAPKAEAQPQPAPVVSTEPPKAEAQPQAAPVAPAEPEPLPPALTAVPSNPFDAPEPTLLTSPLVDGPPAPKKEDAG